MCGIAGYERGAHTEHTARCPQAALANRGPDGAWSQDVGRYCLVQTRLAVIDLDPRVRYPMSNESRDLSLLFNGEIYGYRAMRRELEGHGHRFRTACDAEVVVHAYEEWGIDAFARLNGMFALVLVDERANEVVLARDRYGIKPLVRTTGTEFAFASDALALVASGLSRGSVDEPALSAFVDLHYLPPPLTGLTDVRAVLPGEVVIRDGHGSERSIQWAQSTFVERPAPCEPRDPRRVRRGAEPGGQRPTRIRCGCGHLSSRAASTRRCCSRMPYRPASRREPSLLGLLALAITTNAAGVGTGPSMRCRAPR